jgi:hypothetical protein
MLAASAQAVPSPASAAPTSPAQDGHVSNPEGPGSVFQAPYLPAGFTKTFTSRYVNTGQLRLHAVIGHIWPTFQLSHGAD